MSVEWALGDRELGQEIEAAHTAAVREAVGYITETVPTARRRYGAGVVEEPAGDVVAAEYRHTTARSVVVGEMPDPQLHSHVDRGPKSAPTVNITFPRIDTGRW